MPWMSNLVPSISWAICHLTDLGWKGSPLPIARSLYLKSRYKSKIEDASPSLHENAVNEALSKLSNAEGVRIEDSPTIVVLPVIRGSVSICLSICNWYSSPSTRLRSALLALYRIFGVCANTPACLGNPSWVASILSKTTLPLGPDIDTETSSP